MTLAQPKPSVVTLGEPLGSLTLTDIGTAGTGALYRLGSCGAELNVAIGLSRLGRRTSIIARVGADDIGVSIVRDLRAEGVIVDNLQNCAAAPTGLLIKSQRRAGRWHVDYRRKNSAGSTIDESDIDRDALVGCDALHVTGITPALSDTARQAAMAAVELANEHGRLVSFDVNLRANLWTNRDHMRETLRWFAARAGIIQASLAEAEFLTGQAGPTAAARRLADAFEADAIVRCGADGATGVLDDQLFRAEPHRVVEIDPVGAGDAFTAAYLDARLSKRSPEDCLSRAAIAGALVAATPGDWQGLPTDADLAGESLSRPDVQR